MRIFLSLASICLITFFSCERINSPVLATVDEFEILLNDFKHPYQEFLFKTHQTDNLSNRYALLNSLIDEKLIFNYSNNKRISENPQIILKKERAYKQLLLNTYYNSKIIQKIKVTDSELRRLFTYYKTRLHIRHLYAIDLETIREIEQQLKSGVQWEILAETYFEDLILKENGGDIGWYKMGELDPTFEIAAFALMDGEISNPVKTSNGFSIIQVLEKEKDILLTEKEYQLNKDWLKQMAVTYKKLPELRNFTDKVAQNLEIRFNNEGLIEILDELNNNQEKNVSHNQTPAAFTGNSNIITIEQCLMDLAKLSERQFKRIRSIKTLKSVLSGLLVRNKIINDAENLGLHRTGIFQENLKQEYTSLILKEVMNDIIIDSGSVNWQNEYFKFRNSLAVKSKISIDSVQVKSFPMVVEATL
jgi:foldase protein PrsA